MKIVPAFILISILMIACDSGGSNGNVTIRGAGSSTSASTFFNVDPSEMNLKIYKFAVSENADCSSPITVYENSNPTSTNFLGNPTIGTGSVADGTYPCIIFEVSDNFTFKPATSEGNCVAGTAYTLDICRPDSGVTSTLVDGTVTTCTGSSEPPRVAGDDRIAIYMSTGGTTDAEAFSPGSPITLGSAFTVSGNAVATFVVNGTGAVESQADSCDMGAPAFSFQ